MLMKVDIWSSGTSNLPLDSLEAHALSSRLPWSGTQMPALGKQKKDILLPNIVHRVYFAGQIMVSCQMKSGKPRLQRKRKRWDEIGRIVGGMRDCSCSAIFQNLKFSSNGRNCVYSHSQVL